MLLRLLYLCYNDASYQGNFCSNATAVAAAINTGSAITKKLGHELRLLAPFTVDKISRTAVDMMT